MFTKPRLCKEKISQILKQEFPEDKDLVDNILVNFDSLTEEEKNLLSKFCNSIGLPTEIKIIDSLRNQVENLLIKI